MEKTLKQYFVIGSYTESILFGTGEVFQGKGKGISFCTFEDGKIEVKKEIAVKNPSFLYVNELNKKIYAVNEMKEYLGKTGGGITQLAYDEEGNMRIEGSWNTYGIDPCHISVGPNGQFVAIANYSSGSVTVYPIDEKGNVKNDCQLFQHKGCSIHQLRQEGPHAHSCIFVPDQGLFYVSDLGIDKLVAYRYEGSIVYSEDSASVSVPAGSGPRYGEFGKDGKHFYLINEISSQVMHFTYDAGKMEFQNAVNTIPQDFTDSNTCSDLHMTPDGKFLYASNRGHDSLACYHIEEDGSLTFVERQLCGGKTPRNFAIDPTGKYMLVGNQDSDSITVFEIEENGHINQVNQMSTGAPVCIRFFQL
ncbi:MULTISPECIES: lactonase family protein [unclassified Lacrimispora]|uniref:lactonase family protein n=1 Tax=unclassified Lacrimispora TaxID=2719232 RepID=UPI00376FD040